LLGGFSRSRFSYFPPTRRGFERDDPASTDLYLIRALAIFLEFVVMSFAHAMSATKLRNRESGGKCRRRLLGNGFLAAGCFAHHRRVPLDFAGTVRRVGEDVTREIRIANFVIFAISAAGHFRAVNMRFFAVRMVLSSVG